MKQIQNQQLNAGGGANRSFVGIGDQSVMLDRSIYGAKSEYQNPNDISGMSGFSNNDISIDQSNIQTVPTFGGANQDQKDSVEEEQI